MNLLTGVCNFFNGVFRGLFVADNAIQFTGDALFIANGIRDQPRDYAKLAARGAILALDITAINKDLASKKAQSSKDLSTKIKKESMICQGVALTLSLGIERRNVLQMARLGGVVGSAAQAYDSPALQHLVGPATILATAKISSVLVDKFKDWYARNAADARPVDIDNLDYKAIPDTHHDDDTLRQFICPITTCPIRFPVTAPNRTGGPDHHFERHAIVEWLSQRNINPMNNALLHLRDLRENHEMRAIIEERMTVLGIPL